MPRRAPATAHSEADIAPISANRLLKTRRLAPQDAVDRPLVTVNLAESPLA